MRSYATRAWGGLFIMLSAVGCGEDPAAASCALDPGAVIHRATYTAPLTHPYQPSQLVADRDYVYFADGRGIHRVQRCGGPAEQLIADADPMNDGLAIADGMLYWIEGNDGELGPRIRRAPTGGGLPETLAEYAGYSHRIRAGGGAVVWDTTVAGFPDQSRLLTVPADGGTPRVLAEHRYGWSFDLADGVIYAAGYLPGSDPAASERIVFARALDETEPVVLVDGFADAYPSEPAVAGDHVYYLRRWSTDTLAVERVPRAGGPAEALALAGEGAAGLERLLYAGDQLYGVQTDGGVVRLDPGDPPVPLVARDALGVTSRAFADVMGVFVADASTTCVEEGSDPSGEPPGTFCTRERVDVRVLWLGP